jgi:hypothetical protein
MIQWGKGFQEEPEEEKTKEEYGLKNWDLDPKDKAAA